MSSSGYYVPLTEELEAKLCELPVFRQQIVFERAIDSALDAAGWPRGDRGAVSVGTDHWYVVIYRHGQVRGHVGPLVGRQAAERCAQSWRDGGTRAKLIRQPLGPCLTNAGVASRDVYYP